MLPQSAIVSQLRLANNSYNAGVHGEHLAAALLVGALLAGCGLVLFLVVLSVALGRLNDV